MTTLFRAEIAGLRRLLDRKAKGNLYVTRANEAAMAVARDPRARSHLIMGDDDLSSPAATRFDAKRCVEAKGAAHDRR